jgi:hypothetical protein
LLLRRRVVSSFSLSQQVFNFFKCEQFRPQEVVWLGDLAQW